MQISPKPKPFSWFFIASLKFTLNSEYFEKKISLISQVLPKLLTAKLVATEMSKRPSFMQRFCSQHGNGSPTLLRSARNDFYTTIPLIWGRTSRKRLVLVRSEVLGQFANTSTVHYNILVWIWRIYRIKFKCRYLQNQKLFLDFLLLQWNLRWILSILKKKISLRA